MVLLRIEAYLKLRARERLVWVELISFASHFQLSGNSEMASRWNSNAAWVYFWAAVWLPSSFSNFKFCFESPNKNFLSKYKFKKNKIYLEVGGSNQCLPQLCSLPQLSFSRIPRSLHSEHLLSKPFLLSLEKRWIARHSLCFFAFFAKWERVSSMVGLHLVRICFSHR